MLKLDNLFSSETVIQVTGIRPSADTGPKVQPGQVHLTNVPIPYNERILSSTPMSSPAANRIRPAYSMHSDQSGTSNKAATSNPYLGNVPNSAAPSNYMGMAGPTGSHSFVHPSNAGPTHVLSQSQRTENSYPASQPQANPYSISQSQNVANLYTNSKQSHPSNQPAYHLGHAQEPVTGCDVAPNANMVDAMKRYVTQSDEFLTSFIQGCLAQGNIPIPGSAANAQLGQSQDHLRQSQMSQGQMSQGHMSQGHMSQGQMSQGQMGQGHTSQGQMGQGHMSQGHMSQGHMGQGHTSQGQKGQGQKGQGHMSQEQMGQGDMSQGRMSQVQMSQSQQSQGYNPPQGLGSMTAPQLASDVDIDAILRSHGIELAKSGQPVETLKSQPSALSTSVPNLGHTAYTGKENLAPQLTTDIQEKPEKNVVMDEEPHDETRQEIKQKSKKSPGKSTSKKEKEKAKKKALVNSARNTVVDKPSPADTKTQVRTLLYLFGELRAVTSISRDREAERLLDDMQQMLEQLTPGLSTSGMSTDMDLALQPLRSENAQLRRWVSL